MAAILVGTTRSSFFIDQAILPSTPLLSSFPLGQAGFSGSSAVNYTAGAHVFVVYAGSVVHVADAQQPISGPSTLFTPAFAATGSSSWTVTILGTINAFNTASAVIDGETVLSPNGVGIALTNGGATRSSVVTLGVDASVYGNGAGIASATFMYLNNYGVVGGGVSGVYLTEDAPNGSNLGLTAAGAAKVATVVNRAGAEIFGAEHGVLNDSESTLVVTNLGAISGGTSSLYFGLEGDVDDLRSVYQNAVSSLGSLILTNTATGVIEGDIFSNWTNSRVTNLGQVLGTVTAQISHDYIQDVAPDSGLIPRLNANRDGDFSDRTDYAISSTLLVGMTLINYGIIRGTEDYLREERARPAPFVTYDGAGDPILQDIDGNSVLFDPDGTPYYNTADATPQRVDYVNLETLDFFTADGEIIKFIFDNALGASGEYTLDMSPQIEVVTTQTAFDGSVLRDIISNTAAGRMFGSIFTGEGSDAITNAGHIYGTIDMVEGNDVFVNTASGRVEAVSEQDMLEEFILRMGAGNDIGSISGFLGGGVDMGGGNDTLTLIGTVDGNVLMDDLYDFAGDEIISTNDGLDRVVIGAAGRLFGHLYLGGGTNFLTNSGIIDGNALSIDDNNVVSAVIGREGVDTVFNARTGTIFEGMNLGGGNDIVTNQGRIYNETFDIAALDMGQGNDRMSNSGVIGSTAWGFAHSRTFTTNWFADFDVFVDIGGITIPLALSAGEGDDILTNYAVISRRLVSGNVYGAIDMGAGNDRVIGGAASEVVIDNIGADTYILGAGADAFFISTADAGVDTFDGGTGLDLFGFVTPAGFDPDADVATTGHRIDLAAGQLVYDVENDQDRIGGGAGVDTIRNIEQVVGSVGDDVIIGGIGAETLSGSYGDDTIQGGRGRDYLVGDQGADVFVFTAATDSGRTRATRDVIADFDAVEGDKIWMNIDSNTRSGDAGLNETNEFVFIGSNVAFTGTAGGYDGQFYAEIRAITQAGGTLLEVDTNGDRMADFSISLTGFHNLSRADFYGSNVLEMI